MRDFLDLLFEIIMIIIGVPLIFIGAIFIGIIYVLYCIYQFIKIIIFGR